MEPRENDEQQQQYVAFPLSTNMHDSMQETIISHEEICEPVDVVDDCILSVAAVGSSSSDNLPEVTVNEEVESCINNQVQTAIEIIESNSDPEEEEEDEEGDGEEEEEEDDEDDNSSVYPIYIKQEEQQTYTSGDDESMAVEALRQLGGMYPCSYNEKKISCPNCANLFTHIEMGKHHPNCAAVKLSCTTCGERFERKIDLNNHMVCHQVDRPHACRTCGNLFRSKANLQSHMAQVHQAERPHKCTICNSNFQRPSSLSNHMKIHTYVAGRAIMQNSNNVVQQTVENFRKWPENSGADSPSTSVPSSSSAVSSIPNYEVPQVHWSIPNYNFGNDQPGVAGLNSNHHEKMDSLHDFAVMPTTADVTQFEYAQQNAINHQYNLSMNSTFSSQDGLVKIESLPYGNNETRTTRSFVEVELSEGNNQHVCSHCGVSFSRASSLASHEKIHTCKNWSMPVECEYCDKQFQDGNCLATHQTTCAKKVMKNSAEHGIPNSKWGKHACADCGKKFTTKQKMFRHQWIHRKKTHSCEVCGAQFEKQHELDEHRLSAHPGDSAFTCGECGKSFVSRQGLWEHARTHAGSPAHFHCDVCSKTFSSRQGYLIHHRTHTGERPYGCKFCWKAFRDGGTLRKHERIHTGERPHVCPLCSRAFNQKVVLREHVRWVHAAGKNETEVTGPPFRCPLCGALNQDRDELCAHIVKHSDQMIAEAKAKTNNNASKSKPSKKKSKTTAASSSVSSSKQNAANRSISRTEQNEALLSISDANAKASDSLPQLMSNSKTTDASLLLITTTKRNEVLRINASEVKQNDLHLLNQGKQQQQQQGDGHLHIPQIGINRESINLTANEDNSKQNCDVRMVTSDQQNNSGTRQNESNNAMHLLSNNSKQQNNAVHLVVESNNKQQNNTLHLISKQNESLPVLTIPNPQNHDNFSSQISQMNNIDMPMNMVTTHHSASGSSSSASAAAATVAVVTAAQPHHGDRAKVQISLQKSLIQDSRGSSQSNIIVQTQYQHRENDEGDESVCGMCGEEFTNKNLLMEHVKIHI